MRYNSGEPVFEIYVEPSPDNFKEVLHAATDIVAAFGTVAASFLGMLTAYSTWKTHRDNFNSTIRKRKEKRRLDAIKHDRIKGDLK